MSKTVKAGNPRKSRRKRLPISGGSGPEEKFTPRQSDWSRIQGAYGRELSTDDRGAIVALVDRYFFWQPSEASAPFLDDAISYLNALEKAGRRFWWAIEHGRAGESGGISPSRAQAMIFVQTHVGRYLELFDFRNNTDWDGLVRTTGACVAAVRKARQYITDEAAKSGFIEGASWDHLVWKLSEFAEHRQFPFRISKVDDPSKVSPFVQFIWELQESFPPRFRRHDASPTALAEAVTVARRQIKRALAQRETKKIKSPGRPT